MNLRLRFHLVGAFAAILALNPSASAQQKDEGELTIKIPQPVQAAIYKEKADGKVVDFQRVNEDNGTTYVVRLELDGKKYRLALDAAGRVMGKELDEDQPQPKPLAIDQLPQNVRRTFLREAGGAGVNQVEVREEKKTYVTEILVGKRRYSIEVDADGKLIHKQYQGEAEDQPQ